MNFGLMSLSPFRKCFTGGLKTSIRPSAKARGVLENAAYRQIGEHLQKPRNAGSRPEARFFNPLLVEAGFLVNPPLPALNCRPQGLSFRSFDRAVRGFRSLIFKPSRR
jgi:hypothetical protein